MMEPKSAYYAQIVTGIAACILLPLVLGMRHVHPLVVLPYAGMAGTLFAVGEWTLEHRWALFDWGDFILDCSMKTVAIFLLGGLVFVFAFLAL